MQKMDFSYLWNIWNTAAQPLIENQMIEYFELWLSYEAYFWKKYTYEKVELAISLSQMR